MAIVRNRYLTKTTAAPTYKAPQAPAAQLGALDPARAAAFRAWTGGLAKQGAPGGAIPPQGLSGAQLANYQAQSNTVNDQYRKNIADYEFARGNEGQQYGAQHSDLMSQYGKIREQIPSQYEGRGLLNSGIYGQGLQTYADARMHALGQLLMQHQQAAGGLDLQRINSERTRSTQLSDIAAQRAAAIQALATRLAAVK